MHSFNTSISSAHWPVFCPCRRPHPFLGCWQRGGV